MKKNKKKVNKIKDTSFCSGRRLNDRDVMILCYALISSALCPGANWLTADLHWVCRLDGEIRQVIRRATGDEVVNLFNRWLGIALQCTDDSLEFVSNVILDLQIDYPELMGEVLDGFFDLDEDVDPTLN